MAAGINSSNVWSPSMSYLHPIRACFSVMCLRLDENDGTRLSMYVSRFQKLALQEILFCLTALARIEGCFTGQILLQAFLKALGWHCRSFPFYSSLKY